MRRLAENEMYQRLHTGNGGDLEFYRGVIRGAGSVLEMGCGWGRLTAPLAAGPCALVGVDINPGFVAAAREDSDAARYIEGDITQLRLEERFDRILIPYNTLYSLGGREKIRSCAETAKRLLAPGGEVWFDVYPIDDLHEALCDGEEIPEDDDEPVLQFDLEGQSIEVLERTTFQPEHQRLSVVYTATSAQGLVGELAMTHDYLTSNDLTQVFEEVGFELSTYFGAFHGGACPEGPEQHIFGAQLRT